MVASIVGLFLLNYHQHDAGSGKATSKRLRPNDTVSFRRAIKTLSGPVPAVKL